MCKDLLLQEDTLDESWKTITVDIVSKVAYLLGVEKRIYESGTSQFNLKLDTFEELDKNDEAKLIRVLCILRYKLIQNYVAINQRISYNLESLRSMEDIFDREYFDYLDKRGIDLVKANYKPTNYIIDINKLIVENINNCKSLFPLWVEWEYIKDLFIMKKGTNPTNVKTESNKYTHNFPKYPFQVYISWTPAETCNLLYNDRKFLTLLYKHYGVEFKDYKKVMDASVSIKKSIYNFLEENDDTVVVVDCENSDPYKLCGVIKSLNEEELGKIRKIILLNDVHTATAWKILEKLVSIPVEYLLIERVKDSKSLIDITVTAKTCKEHYVNKINSFILCSSDSDYWGLITSLKDAKFLVMVEDKKCGKDIQNAMDESGIVYCSMDDFTDGNINNIKVTVLKSEIEEYISKRVNLNVNDMLDHVYTITRIDMGEKEKKQFYNNYIKNMRLVIGKDGTVEVVLK